MDNLYSEEENKIIKDIRNEILSVIFKKAEEIKTAKLGCICNAILSAYISVLINHCDKKDLYSTIIWHHEKLILTLGYNGYLDLPNSK